MLNRRLMMAIAVLLSVLLLTGCGPVEPTATPAPPAATPAAIAPPTASPIPPAATPAASALPPTATSSPPPTGIPATETATDTVVPTPEPIPDESTIAGVLANLEGLPIDQFFEASYLQLGLRDPDYLVTEGLADELGIANDRFTDMSDAYIRQTQQLVAGILDLLRGYDRSAMTPEQQLSYDVYEWILDDRVRGHEFMYYDYPVNPMSVWGIQTWLIDFMVNYQPIADRKAAEDYIARLSGIDTWMEQLLEGLKLREAAGVILPRFLIPPTISQIEDHVQMHPSGEAGGPKFAVEEIELYTSFRDKLGQVEGISEDEEQALLDRAKTAIEETVIPAFLELREYLSYLEQVATQDAGVWKFPNGEAYYAYELQHNLTTDVGPDEIHALGLAEVERLQKEMRQVAHDELGYPLDISMEALFQRLWTDSEFFEGDALLAEYWRLIEEADQAAGDFFDLRPSADLVIRSDPLSTVAYYRSPPLDGSGPGIFTINLEAGPTPHYQMPTVAYHETVPGHHFQGALALEFDLPTFRRNLVLNAYNEGWALYAERLAWEMGLYKGDPLGNLGRLALEIERAARVVVDTGLHDLGWTMHQAATYFQEETGVPYNYARLTRYLVLPGQGCSYTIGYLKIMELRQRAMDQLGDEFDIKEFHNLVLGQGALPLEILERLVDEWIETGVTP
jgi:uncharacterized protein (DUF885 family)